MVKFGRHLQFYIELEHPNKTHSIVPYAKLRDLIEQATSITPTLSQTFESQWHDALLNASTDLTESTKSFWNTIFESISSQNDNNNDDDVVDSNHILARGIEPFDAIKLYIDRNDIAIVRDMLCFLKDTHTVAEMNYQALRKIVKKFDKNVISQQQQQQQQKHVITSSSNVECLSSTLLPELYTSITFFGRNTLDMAIHIFRTILEELSSSDGGSSSSGAIGSGSGSGSGSQDNTNHSSGRISNSNHNSNTEELHSMMQSINSMEDEKVDDRKNNYYNSMSFGSGSVNGTGTGTPKRKTTRSSSKTIYGSKDKKNETLQKVDDITNKMVPHHHHQDHDEEGEVASEESEDQVVSRRANEIQWLNDAIQHIPKEELCHIVAHRGFHTSLGRSDFRPIENTLSAYETAWSAGVHLCECDVALTRDEKLVLAHDEDFNRLALDRTSDRSRLKISELTFKELIALTLKNGVRAPLLKDVLMSANAIGPDAKLIIEIKPGNSEAGMALARLLARYPELVTHVAVVMSFDLWSMHSFKEELQRSFFGSVSTTGGTSSISPEILSSPFSNNLRRKCKSTSVLFGSSFNEPSFLMNREESAPIRIDGGRERRDRSDSLITYNTSHNHQLTLPSVMLLTVADTPENMFELSVDISDYSPIEDWLHSTHTSLDGVYVRYEPGMLTPEGKVALQKLSSMYTVGVWAKAAEDPDDYETMHYLVKECGVSFFNTDLPRSYIRNP